MSNQLKRRNFLGTGLSAAVAMNLGVSSFGEASECPGCGKGKSKIGAILYTLREYLNTPDEVARTFEKIKKIGYDNVEITSVDEIETSKLKTLLKEHELIPISAHTSYDAVTANPQQVIDRNKELGCPNVFVSYMTEEHRTLEGYIQFAEKLSDIGAQFAEAGINFGYHNHSFEFQKYDGTFGQDILRLYSVPKYFCFEIDTYWVQHGGGDPAAWIRKFAGRVPVVHMKDFLMVEGDGTQFGTQMYAEVGEGNLNWPEILNACKDAGVQYYVVEQDQCQRDPFESIAISLKNLKSWGLV